MIDEIKIQDYSISSLRKNIGFISQDVHLFSDTIFNNIVLYDKKITLENVKKAANDIQINDFIESLPGGV